MTRIRFHRTIQLVALSLIVAACDRAGADMATDEGGAPPPPAAALSADPGLGLDSRLEQLERDLGRVIDAGFDDESKASILAAEATTDRLLEEQPTADWLAAGYLVEARLRQIQALADRIVAEMTREVAKELVLADVAALRGAVRDLRAQLASQNNGAAPSPLDSLLAGYGQERDGLGGVPATSASTDTSTTTAEPAEPTAAPEGGPLGEPIRP
jgi:hypothetical protein